MRYKWFCFFSIKPWTCLFGWSFFSAVIVQQSRKKFQLKMICTNRVSDKNSTETTYCERQKIQSNFFFCSKWNVKETIILAPLKLSRCLNFGCYTIPKRLMSVIRLSKGKGKGIFEIFQKIYSTISLCSIELPRDFIQNFHLLLSLEFR